MSRTSVGIRGVHTWACVSVFVTIIVSWVACSEDNSKEPQPPIANSKAIHHAYPFWSRDGSNVYYYDHGIVEITNIGAKIDQNKVGLWSVRLIDGSKRQIMRGGGRSGSVGPNGESLVYEHGGKLYVVKLSDGGVDSTTLSLLTPEGSNFFPSWNADGSWIAFDSNYGDPKGAQVIWKIRSDGSGLTDISEHGVGEWRMPDWHPTLSTIVHIRYPGQGTFSSEIYTMTGDGSSALRLTNNERVDLNPKFSPDGHLICFDSSSPTDFAIWLMNSDGSDQRRLVAGKEPSWSPDGTRIAFVSLSTDESEYGFIWVIDIDGSNPTQITFPD